MATVKAKNILDRAGTILQDTTGTRWPEEELLDWLNDSQREIVLHRPDACAVNEAIAIAAGSSKQTLPSAALKLIDIVRNVTLTIDSVTGDVTNIAAGNAIRSIERRVLDDQVPGWHSEDADASSGEVKHFVYDERDPKSFYVYPRLTAAGHIEAIYSSAPQDVAHADLAGTAAVAADANATPPVVAVAAVAAATISLDDIYANAILDYVLYRAYSKDADYAANAQRAVGHYQAFLGSMGVSVQSDQMTELKSTTNDGTPGNAVVPKPQRPQ